MALGVEGIVLVHSSVPFVVTLNFITRTNLHYCNSLIITVGKIKCLLFLGASPFHLIVIEEEVKEPSNRIVRFAVLNVRKTSIVTVAGITYVQTATKGRLMESTSFLITMNRSKK